MKRVTVLHQDLNKMQMFLRIFALIVSFDLTTVR